ncbi:MAG: hypothetical protein K0M40_10555 [Prolixibacteraceae bacterium]|nr:hypothetical protein [Prolixibacteraceae bacterium]
MEKKACKLKKCAYYLKVKMNNYIAFVDTSDSYSDIWPVFFDMFTLYWPNFKGIIYLNTEYKTYSHGNLNIICTQVGKRVDYGKYIRDGLEKIDADWIMYFPVDCIFMGEVDKNRLDRYLHFFKEMNLDSFSLIHQNYRETIQSDESGVSMVIPPTENMFSTQIAFWKKSTFYQLLLPHENPWSAEWFGTKRANKMKIKLACPTTKAHNPLHYDLHGCLGRGKWLDNAIKHLNNLNYEINFDRRGYYTKPEITLKFKLKEKWMLVHDGLKGSYLDLLKRQLH